MKILCNQGNLAQSIDVSNKIDKSDLLEAKLDDVPCWVLVAEDVDS